MGIEEERVRLEWISAAEGEKVKSVVNDMVEKVTALGPLGHAARSSRSGTRKWTRLEQSHAAQSRTRHVTKAEVAHA